MRTLDISEFWDGEGKPEVVIKRISFGQQNDILDIVSNVSAKGKVVEIAPKYGMLRTLTVNKCIVSAPFPNTMEYLQNEMTTSLGDYLFEQIDIYNNLRSDKKKSLEVVGAV
mgnify:CR=1 FL=1